MRTLLLFLLIAILPITASAQSTVEMKEEAGQALEKSDKAMNVAYQQLMKVLEDEGKTRLREAQRAWVAFRDTQASFDSHALAGGTMEGLEYMGSLKILTDERTKRLKEDYDRFK